MSSPREALPLAPLLHAHAAAGLPSPGVLHQLPGLGGRFSAVLGATARFLYADFLDRADDAAVADALVRFYDAVVPLPLHANTLRRRAGFVRHAVSALLHGQAGAAEKMAACLGGTYHAPGLGPAFWSALLQALCPARLPGWTALTLAGARRLGFGAPPGATPAAIYDGLLDAHQRARCLRQNLSALHVDHFLSLVAVMPGRSPHEGAEALGRCLITPAVRRSRSRTPLRERLKGRGEALAEGQRLMAAGLAAHDGKMIGEALAFADPGGAARCRLDWGDSASALTSWLSRLWECDDPQSLLSDFWRADPILGAGLWLPCAALHLRDPQRYWPYNDVARQAHAAIDDGLYSPDPPAERYRLFNEACAVLRERFTLHPLEVPDVLAALIDADEPEEAQPGFRGFCADTFVFLGELAHENRRDWMDAQRHRYAFAVREPLVELCRTLAERYVTPVLCRRHGFDLDVEAASGHALTSVAKNAFGRSVPYNAALWVTFCRAGTARASAQLYVRLCGDGLRWGLRLGRSAKRDRDRLRAAVERDAAGLFAALRDNGALESHRFGVADLPETFRPLTSPDELLAWARGGTLEACQSSGAADALATSDDLAGEVLLGFDRLLPLFAAAMRDDATPAEARGYADGAFLTQTHLSAQWLTRAKQLLSLKKQLILQGVPGTGKTHVARCLARLLAGDPEAVRLVQFHPAYSYEEFVEGIRVKSIAVEGRHDVSYPVEDGLLCAFAARAAERPAQPHVLVIDEINRGNLPRIFGELLYLLEYRGQAVELPCSRRSFRLPPNLYVVATMNAADRSIAALDQALRRRFSFVEMEPDADVLAAWLRANPPPGGPAAAARVLGVFERLNAKLIGEAGTRVGHSYFMVEGLDDDRLRMIWHHHVRPIVEEHFSAQPGRAAAYDALFETPRGRRAEPTARA